MPMPIASPVGYVILSEYYFIETDRGRGALTATKGKPKPVTGVMLHAPPTPLPHPYHSQNYDAS